MVPVAAVLSIAVALAVGVFGALHVAHAHLGQSLRTGTSSAAPAHRRLRGALVVGQVALSTTLLAGAVVLVRVVVDFTRVHVGFDPRDLYAVSFGDRDLDAMHSPEALAARADLLRDAAGRQLGTRSVTLAATVTDGMAFASAPERRDRPAVAVPAGITGLNFVAPDYFAVMRMPLLAGRTFDAGSLARDEVVVNRALARQLGDDGTGGTILGRQFRFRARRPGRTEPWQTVIGVAPDLLANRLDRAAQPTLFRPFPPPPGDAVVGMTVIVRLPGNDASALQRFARSVSGGALRWRVAGVQAGVDRSMAEPRFTMAVLVAFAVCGVLLAAIGLFGVVSYGLALRTREIGVRVTLGATRRTIVGLLVRGAMGQAALGTAMGLAGAAIVARLAQTSIHGAERIGPGSFLLAAGAMLLASLAACVGPLVRAARVDPAVAVRAE